MTQSAARGVQPQNRSSLGYLSEVAALAVCAPSEAV